MATVKRELTTNFTSGQAVHHNKISSIGPGFLVWSVQSASYYKVFPAPHQLGLLGLGDELVFVDADEGTLMGETMDLHHGSPFVKTPNVVSSKDYLVTADSIVAIVTAAARQWISNSCSLEAECTSLKLCIGSGCNLDTARSRFLIGQRLGIRSESCHGLILGEHGDSSAHGALLRSVPLQDPSSHTGTAKDPGRREGVHGQVVARSTSFHVITFTF